MKELGWGGRRRHGAAKEDVMAGRARLLPVAKRLGWRYDSSGARRQTWPTRDESGLWDLSMASIPFGGREVVSMDYNFMVQLCRGDVAAGTEAQRRTWRAKVSEALLAGFDRAYAGNRAPYLLGNHFEQWNGGIYMDAIEDAMRAMAAKPGCGSCRSGSSSTGWRPRTRRC